MRLQAFDNNSIKYAKSRSKEDAKMDELVQYLIAQFGGREVPLTDQDYEQARLRGVRLTDDRVHLHVPPQLNS